MSEGNARPIGPTPEQWELELERVHQLVRTRWKEFKEAGAWLDHEYSESKVRARRKAAEKNDLRMPASAAQIGVPSKGKDCRVARLGSVLIDVRISPPQLGSTAFEDPLLHARRLLLLVCLVTDRDATEYTSKLTELGTLPWTAQDSRGGMGRAWVEADDVREGLPPWASLVSRAMGIVRRRAEAPSSPVDQAFGAATDFLDHLYTLADAFRRYGEDSGPSDRRLALGGVWALAQIAGDDLRKLLKPEIVKRVRLLYPVDAAPVRIGKLPASQTMIEVVGEGLTVYFRNLFFQDAPSPLDKTVFATKEDALLALMSAWKVHAKQAIEQRGALLSFPQLDFDELKAKLGREAERALELEPTSTPSAPLPMTAEEPPVMLVRPVPICGVAEQLGKRTSSVSRSLQRRKVSIDKASVPHRAELADVCQVFHRYRNRLQDWAEKAGY